MDPIRLTEADARAVLDTRVGLLEPLRGKNVFVTGGTGFLGAWLLELFACLNRDHGFGTRVVAMSREARAFGARWPHLGRCEWLRLLDGDVRYFADLPSDTHYVIHAAALTDRRICASRPSSVADVNVVGTQRVFRAAERLEELRGIVLMSSGLAAGQQAWEQERIDESHAAGVRCDTVTSVYAESKRMAEIVAHCAMSEWKAPVVVLRPFAFVGPYQNLQLPWAVTDFIRDSLHGGPLRIMGDGSTVRSILYASDFAYWVLAALARGTARTTYNVGSPDPVTLADLATRVVRQFSPAPVVLTGVGQRGHDRTRLVPSVERICSEIGVRSTVSLEDAVARSIAWHRALGSA